MLHEGSTAPKPAIVIVIVILRIMFTIIIRIIIIVIIAEHSLLLGYMNDAMTTVQESGPYSGPREVCIPG